MITGGAGIICSHTVDLLLANQSHVIVLDNLASGNLAHLDLGHPHLTFVQDDIFIPLLLNLLKDCDAVLHLAALPSVPKSIDDPLASLRINTEGFVTVLRRSSSNKPIRFVYASGAAVYGDSTKLPCQDEEGLLEAALSLCPR